MYKTRKKMAAYLNTTGESCTEEGEQETVTLGEVLQSEEQLMADVNAVLGAIDDKKCTYNEGYMKRQALYSCLTCIPEAKTDVTKCAGVCLGCCYNCHEGHELIELYTKRNFRCDCGNSKFPSRTCTLKSPKEDNDKNLYNQNFTGVYCICQRPYPDPEDKITDEMIQCIICEDWFHTRHLGVSIPPQNVFAEMCCESCIKKHEFLLHYDESNVLTVKSNETEPMEVDVVNEEEHVVSTSEKLQECKDNLNTDDSGDAMNTEEVVENILVENSDLENLNKCDGDILTDNMEQNVPENDQLSEDNQMLEKISENGQIPGIENILIEESATENDVTKDDQIVPAVDSELEASQDNMTEFSGISENNQTVLNKNGTMPDEENCTMPDEENGTMPDEENGTMPDKENGMSKENGTIPDENQVSGDGEVLKESINTEIEENYVPESSKIEQNETEIFKPPKNVEVCRKPKVKSDKICTKFWTDIDWRLQLCTCTKCMNMYGEEKVLFLIDPEDTVHVYEEKGKAKAREQQTKQEEANMKYLNSLDRVPLMEAIAGYNNLKTNLMEYLKKFADNKKVVREEDIKEFFDKFDTRKRFKCEVPHFCR